VNYANVTKALAGVALSIALGGTTARAAIITGSASDFEPRIRTGGTQTAEGPYDPGPSRTEVRVRTGQQLNFQISSAYFFQLPAVAPSAITSANLILTSVADTAATAVLPTFNADLVALGFVNTQPPGNLTADSQRYFFFGAEGATDAAAGENGAARQLIQDNFLVPPDFIALGGASVPHGTSDAADAALLGYIQGLYANPAFMPGSSYLVLRLNADAAAASASTTMRYTTATAESTAVETRPVLDLAYVPEPSTGAFVVVAAIGLLRRK
jgi:hypothetical protein